MIQPDGIRRKAENLYPELLRAWMAGEPMSFPRLIPTDRTLHPVIATAIEEVGRLRDGSKEALGHGYTVEWKEIRSRKYGRNCLPERIVFDTPEDLLRFIRKEREFASFTATVESIRREFPELNRWVRTNVRMTIEAASEVDGLLEVTRYLLAHPRPGCFARELPLRVDTKFIERNASVLRSWLDLVLPPHAIRADEDHFERRFGLRYAEPLLFVRVLDPAIQCELGLPFPILSVPLTTLAAWTLQGVVVAIVENAVNLLTLPPMPRGLVLGGLGDGASVFRYVPWLSEARLIYWGDLDVQGLAILSRLRALYPHTQSMFMESSTLDSFEPLLRVGSAIPPTREPPAHLFEREAQAFRICAARNLRLEQERIPQVSVEQAFLTLASTV